MSSDTMPSVPLLRKDDKYHVFISYSNGDSIWVAGLIHKLEAAFPDLKICFHERDFVPGKSIIDNMVECIQRSQKTVIVLSPDFVRSRWCLFEANLSMFQDCIVQKIIIPIMLKPCPIPLHLSYLTYLEADDEQFFDKLTQVLLGKNSQLVHSTLIHYQPSFLYNGKNLLTLPALNENSQVWEPGVFASDSVPDSLKAVLDDATIYKEAVNIINDIPPSDYFVFSILCQVVWLVILLLVAGLGAGLYFATYDASDVDLLKIVPFLPIPMAVIMLIPIVFVKIVSAERRQTKLVTRTMVYKTSQANLILSKSSVLAGCSSKSEMYFVYVSLYQCMETFYTTFGHGSKLATDMWEKAIITYSSDYACCLAKKHFPFTYTDTDSPGHSNDGICFCQYVCFQLYMEK